MKVWPTFCKHCGHGIERGAAQCPACGASIAQEQFESDATAPGAEFPRRVEFLEPKAATSDTAKSEFASNEPGSQVAGSVVSRKQRPPVLEILVAILLLGGAAMAIWIMRSSLPARNASSAGVVIAISPRAAHVAIGKSMDVAATVLGADDVEVSWSIQEGDAGGRIETRGARAVGGTVSSLAVYLAPKQAGKYHVVATSKADPAKTAVAVITVVKR